MPGSSPHCETIRLESLNAYRLLDTPPEQSYDNLTELCAQLCDAPICIVSLVDRDRLWFKSKFGLDAESIDRADSFCNEAIGHEGLFVVEDAAANEQFATCPLVTGALAVRFYASYPLIGREGQPLGTLCVLDTAPRKLKPRQAKALQTLGQQVLSLIELHRTVQEFETTEQQYARDSQRLQMTIESSRIGVWDWNIETNEVYLDPGWEAILDYAPGELLGHVDTWRNSIYDEDQLAVFEVLDRHLADPTSVYEVEYRAHRKHGGLKWILTRGRTVSYTPEGKPARMIGTIIDVTARKQTEAELFEIQDRFRSAIESMREGLMVRSRTGEVQLYNNRALEILDVTGRQLEGLDPFPEGIEVFFEGGAPVTAEQHPSQQCLQTGKPVRDQLLRFERPGERTQWISVNASPQFRPGETRADSVVVTFADVTESKLLRDEIERQITQVSDINVQIEMQRLELEDANERLEQLATSDGLTGLKNHRFFQERLADECTRCERYNSPLCVLLLDVDKFKQYNDTFGHPAGDEVLRTVGRLLAESARTNDVVARYGGEEFTLLLPETDLEAAAVVAERCREAIESHAWPDREVTASFGVANWTLGLAPADLVANADAALYASKSAGRNRVTLHSESASGAQDSQASSSAQAAIARE